MVGADYRARKYLEMRVDIGVLQVNCGLSTIFSTPKSFASPMIQARLLPIIFSSNYWDTRM